MNSGGIVHFGGLAAAFAAVSVGSYGLLRQIALLGLWPIERSNGRTWYREIGHRLGRTAAQRGWFEPLRRNAKRNLARARQVDIAPDDFVGESMLYALIAAASAWAVTVVLGGSFMNIIPAAVAGFVLFQVPGWNLKGAADRRIGKITRRLPYSLEVIVLATDSGAGFEEALEILVREDPANPLHEEFDQVLRDAALGLKRQEALHNMAARVGTEDILSLVLALDISENLGTPLAETLKKQAEAIRASRLQRAERMAREAGPKMAVPNTMIMVANVLLILGPFLPKLSLSGI
jgi:tight adherence protein C